jgi:hypothetical protein
MYLIFNIAGNGRMYETLGIASFVTVCRYKSYAGQDAS